jgi:hypothetical protein
VDGGIRAGPSLPVSPCGSAELYHLTSDSCTKVGLGRALLAAPRAAACCDTVTGPEPLGRCSSGVTAHLHHLCMCALATQIYVGVCSVAYRARRLLVSIVT